jgi:LacI family transcriptional regulator
MERLWTIGLHMFAGGDFTRRVTDGVLRYVCEASDVAVRDFCYPQADESPAVGMPPWLGKVDGMIVSARRTPQIVEWVRRGRAAVVTTSADMSKDFVTVTTDPKSLAHLGADHLAAMKGRHFAYVGYRHSDGSLVRARAFAAELAKHRLRLQSYHTQTVFGGSYEDFTSLDEVEPGLLRFLRRAKKPLAIATLNDSFAVALCRIAELLGLAVPEDVAVLGSQNSNLARVASPTISSIRIDEERIGYEAARLLHRILLGQRLARRLVLVPAQELIARESTVGQQRANVTDIEQAREFIRQNIGADIHVGTVAAHVCVPRRTFEIEFAAAVGHTVGKEIRDVRLARVKTLLQATDLPLDTVARQAGFSSVGGLNEFFIRWAGTTPTRYRGANKEER